MFDPTATTAERAAQICEAGCRAQAQLSRWPEARVLRLTEQMAARVDRAAGSLAAAVVESTGQGRIHDRRDLLRLIAARSVQGSDKPCVGFIGEDAHGHITLAEPIGLVLALISDELPVASALHLCLAAIRARNALLLLTVAPSLLAPLQSLVKSVLEDAGAPADLIQVCAPLMPKQFDLWLRATEVSEVVVCGDGPQTQAALRCGKPTLGVPIGNTPCVVLDDANALAAADRILASKALDHGLHRVSEQQLILTPKAEQAMLDVLEARGAVLLSGEQANAFRAALTSGAVPPGLSAAETAGCFGLHLPPSTTLLLVPAVWNPGSRWLRPVYSPALPMFSAADPGAALQLARRIATAAGPSLHCAIHTHDDEALAHFVAAMPCGRVLINAGATQSALGIEGKLPCSVVYSAGPRGAVNITHEHLRTLKRVIRTKSP